MKNQSRMLSVVAAALLLGLSGCFRLDSNLYNADNTITEYQFDQYIHPDEWDIDLDSTYTIADSNIHQMTLNSQAADESTPTKIAAIYLGEPSRIATDTVILYCHGNYGHMDVYWQRMKALANLGHKHRFGVLAFDYRGFGMSEGSATEAGMYADAAACVDWLKAMGLSSNRFIMYGFSLGSAAATELTAHPASLTPNWLLLEAPFASAEMMAQEGTGLAVPGSFFTNLKIDNADEIKLVEQPFYWLHGIDDHFLSYENHGLSVWNNYQGSRGVRESVPGAGHGNIVGTMGIEAYQASVLRFILNQ
jgi:pimeloyl-ACP methyl ester carboxylesterase